MFSLFDRRIACALLAAALLSPLLVLEPFLSDRPPIDF
jgi:hypothetical protein